MLECDVVPDLTANQEGALCNEEPIPPSTHTHTHTHA